MNANQGRWTISILILLALPSMTIAQDDQYEKTGPRPGEENPYKTEEDSNLYRDDEGVFFLSGDKTISLTKLWISESSGKIDSGKCETRTEAVNDPAFKIVKAAAGRFAPEYEQIARAFFLDKEKFCIEILNKDLTAETKLSMLIGDFNTGLFEIASGNFFPNQDADEEYHDEILYVHYAAKGNYFSLRLYDRKLNLLPAFAGDGDGSDPHLGKYVCANSNAPIGIRIEKGDFNNDGHLDFVLVYATEKNGFVIQSYTFDPDDSLYHREEPMIADLNQSCNDNIFDTAAGDFNGDGLADLAVFYTDQLRLYAVDANNADVKTGRIDPVKFLFQQKEDFSTSVFINVRMTAGFFVYDPEQGYDALRKQLAVITADWLPIAGYKSKIAVHIVQADRLFSLTNVGEYTLFPTNLSNEFHGVDCIAGNFMESPEGNVPSNMEEILVAYSEANEYIFLFSTDAKGNPKILENNVFPGINGNSRIAVLRYDADGDSLILGAPVHLVLEDFISAQTIIQEPPKHLDYLPLDYKEWENDNNKWGIKNVNAYRFFKTAYSYEEEKLESIESTEHSSVTWGLSEQVSAKGTLTEDNIWLKTELSIEASEKLGWDWTTKKEHMDEEYQATTQELAFEANEDDILYGKIQLIDVWRYPLVNQKDSNGNYLFQDVVLPGPKYRFAGQAHVHDFYQPSHINRNLFSYPDFSPSFPADMGSYKVLKDGKEEEIEQTWNDLIHFTYSSNQAEIKVNFSQKTAESDETIHENAFNQNYDLQVGYKAKARSGEITGEIEGSLTLALDRYKNWGDNKIAKNEQASSKGIRIEQPETPFTSDWTFSYVPAVYVMSKGGGLKTAFAVDFRSLGNAWYWYYGSRPDPALALPNRFEPTYADQYEFETWHLNQEETRMAMQGFFMYAVNSNSDEKVLHPGTGIEEGDKIELAARVYNLSLVDIMNAPFHVRFEAVLFDPSQRVEASEERIFIGETTVTSLAAREKKEASVVWDTTGFGLPSDGNLGYRIYVTVDPENAIPNEIHEWKDEEHPNADGWTDKEGRLYHGNNEGYFPHNSCYFVGKRIVGAEPPSYGSSPQIFLHEDSLAIQTGAGLLSSGEIRIPLGSKYDLRAKIHCEGTYLTKSGFVVFHDRSSLRKEETIGIQTLYGLREDNYAWISWRPKETGVCELWAVFLEHSNDPQSGNAKDLLRVTVYDPREESEIGAWPLY
ncbi:MAG: VCBS repeat-containing protein [Candidatus Omnitrophota bacterium]